MGSSVPGRVSRCRPAWRKCMISTIRLVSTIELLVCQRLTPLVIIGNYDFVLLDSPPDLGILTLSALIAANEVIIPVDVGFFSVVGLARMVSFVDDVRDTYNASLMVLGVLATKYDSRTTLSENAFAQIKSQGLPVFDSKIRICVEIIRSQVARWPVSLYAEGSNGALDYNALAHELLAE